MTVPKSIVTVKKGAAGTSLGVQWLRIGLAMQDMGLIPGQGTKIPRAVEQLSLRATTAEPGGHN